MVTTLRKVVRAAASLCSRPSHLGLLFSDARGPRKTYSDREHLDATIQWLCRAQDATGSGGVSAAYSALDHGWLGPYPETTGYIIPTFLRYAELTGQAEFADRAIRMGEWENDIQMPSGAVRGGIGVNDFPITFNTGQVIHGWVALFRHTGDERFINAAERAARWLVAAQASDGSWVLHTPLDKAHPYYTFVTWAMLDFAAVTGDHAVTDAATRNIEWTLTQANREGWFRSNGFPGLSGALTHFFGYTVQGLLECVPNLKGSLQRDVLTVARKAGERSRIAYEQLGGSRFFPASLDEHWQSSDGFSCVTGDAQFALIWLALAEHDHDARYTRAAVAMLDFVKSTQSLSSRNPGIRGGVPGSYPCWGKYFRLGFPNWAAKFFSDAVLLRASRAQASDAERPNRVA